MAKFKLFSAELPKNTDDIVGQRKQPVNSHNQGTNSYPCHTDGCSSGCHSTSCACSNQHNCRSDEIAEETSTPSNRHGI